MYISYRLRVLTANEDADTGRHKRPDNHGMLVFSDKGKWTAMADLLRGNGVDVYQFIRLSHNGADIDFHEENLIDVVDTLRTMVRAVEAEVRQPPKTVASVAAE